MKKFLKVLIIVLLVLGAIGGTCVFFFKKYKEENNTTDSFANFLSVENNKKFNDDIVYISNEIVKKSDATDTRLDLVIDINEKLDKIIYVLATYHVETDTKITNEEISKKFNEVKVKKSLLLGMMEEYKIKSTSNYFDKHLGLNDFYVEVSSYLVECAKLANLINSNLNLNKNVDIKFNIFEIYCSIVVDTYSNLTRTKYDSTILSSDDLYLISVLNTERFNVFKNRININNLFVLTFGASQFSINYNNFNYYYSNCDKNLFVQNLMANIGSVSSAEQETNEKIATYYFKLIMGL